MIDFCDSPSLLPDFVAHVSARFDMNAGSTGSGSIFGVQLPEHLARAAPKRRAEFAAGRACAERALQAVVPGFTGAVASAGDRSPLWPPGVVGSLTHSDGFASAAVAPAALALSIGIDTEHLLTSDALSSVRQVVAATPRAEAELALAEDVYYTLQFSAKESLFKCLYPLARQMFFFEHASVTLASDDGHFQATLLTGLGDRLPANLTLQGRYVIDGSFVHTAILLEPAR